jgi:DNA-binding CsgD family transcriptional regulator
MRRFKVTILYSDKIKKEIVHIFHDIKKTDGIEKLTKMICNSDIDLPTPELYEYLTPRENQSLKLLASGCTIKEIAEILEIKKFTARNYILNVMHKLNAKTQLQAVINAARLQIL